MEVVEGDIFMVENTEAKGDRLVKNCEFGTEKRIGLNDCSYPLNGPRVMIDYLLLLAYLDPQLRSFFIFNILKSLRIEVQV